MEFFSEIYGAYYRIVEKILAKPKLTLKDIQAIITENAFDETGLYIDINILKNDWGLLKPNPDNTFSPITKNIPPKILTNLQKSYIKAKLADPRSHLFLDQQTHKNLSQKLADTQPLYQSQNFHFFDVFEGGDSIDQNYIDNFNIILNSIKQKRIIKINYSTPKSGEMYGKFLPYKIQFSPKNNIMRLICFRLKNNQIEKQNTINISRIILAEQADEFINYNENELPFEKYKQVELEVSYQRNGIERFMNEFAPYRKKSEYNSGYCKVILDYNKSDETELLIRILSFGTVIKIISPEMREKAKERIEKQYKLLFGKDC